MFNNFVNSFFFLHKTFLDIFIKNLQISTSGLPQTIPMNALIFNIRQRCSAFLECDINMHQICQVQISLYQVNIKCASPYPSSVQTLYMLNSMTIGRKTQRFKYHEEYFMSSCPREKCRGLLTCLLVIPASSICVMFFQQYIASPTFYLLLFYRILRILRSVKMVIYFL